MLYVFALSLSFSNKVMLERRKRNAIIGRHDEVVQPLVFSPSQQAILAELMAFDMKLALDARTSDLNLSPVPLDQATSNLLSCVKVRGVKLKG
jgi:hypothetical protein